MTKKQPTNIEITSRIRQFIVLILAIVAGMIISSSLEAADFRRATTRHHRQKYRAQFRRSGKECRLLAYKRDTPPKTTYFASRPPKRRPQAEVGESPGRVQVAGAPQNRHLGN